MPPQDGHPRGRGTPMMEIEMQEDSTPRPKRKSPNHRPETIARNRERIIALNKSRAGQSLSDETKQKLSRIHNIGDQAFWRHVQKTDSCWLWTGSTNGTNGYGVLGIGSKLDGTQRMMLAHRRSWEIHHGPIPEGLKVLHNCPDGDNPLCVNPDHLWLGTQLDNVRDMIAKGRGRYTGCPGLTNGSARLSPEQVHEIRARYAAGGIRQIDLAREYGIRQATISRVILGNHWTLRPDS